MARWQDGKIIAALGVYDRVEGFKISDTLFD
jgi:hypothetical protein